MGQGPNCCSPNIISGHNYKYDAYDFSPLSLFVVADFLARTFIRNVLESYTREDSIYHWPKVGKARLTSPPWEGLAVWDPEAVKFKIDRETNTCARQKPDEDGLCVRHDSLDPRYYGKKGYPGGPK